LCLLLFKFKLYTSVEYNTLLGVEGDPFPPQAAAAYFHRYGIGRDVDYILVTFPILARC